VERVGDFPGVAVPSFGSGAVRHGFRHVGSGSSRRDPEEHGRLRPNGYSGLRRVWTQFRIERHQ
jgi:hypothetical protein